MTVDLYPYSISSLTENLPLALEYPECIMFFQRQMLKTSHFDPLVLNEK